MRYLGYRLFYLLTGLVWAALFFACLLSLRSAFVANQPLIAIVSFAACCLSAGMVLVSVEKLTKGME